MGVLTCTLENLLGGTNYIRESVTISSRLIKLDEYMMTCNSNIELFNQYVLDCHEIGECQVPCERFLLATFFFSSLLLLGTNGAVAGRCCVTRTRARQKSWNGFSMERTTGLPLEATVADKSCRKMIGSRLSAKDLLPTTHGTRNSSYC
jgi:hypothetical protein